MIVFDNVESCNNANEVIIIIITDRITIVNCVLKFAFDTLSLDIELIIFEIVINDCRRLL